MEGDWEDLEPLGPLLPHAFLGPVASWQLVGTWEMANNGRELSPAFSFNGS